MRGEAVEASSVGVSAPWTTWHELSQQGDRATVVVLAAHPDGRMHAVIAGPDGQLWHSEQESPGVSAPWTMWHELSEPGDVAGAVALVAHPDGRMHAVIAGADRQLWHNEQESAELSAPWTRWHALSQPGDLASAIALSAHPDGRVHAVMAGTDGQLWHNEQVSAGVSAPWTGWYELSQPGDAATAVALAAHADGRMHAVVVGLDGQLWHNEQQSADVSAPWTMWHELSRPGDVGRRVALAAHPDGRMHAVMVGPDGQLHHNEQESAEASAPWTMWHELSQPGDRANTVALAVHPDGRMHAVISAPDGQLWHNEQEAAHVSASWTYWHELSTSGDLADAVALAVHPDGRMHAVTAGPGGQLWHNEQSLG